MRALLFCVLLLALPAVLCAQSSEPRLASGSEYLVRPNEFGVNLAPAAVFLLRGESNRPRFALTYKRLVEDKKQRRGAWRASVSWISPRVPGQQTPYEASLLESRTDTSEIRIEQHDRDVNLGGFVGFELRYRKNNWFVVSGVDIYARSVSQRSEVFRKTYEIQDGCLDGDCAVERLSIPLQTATASSFEVGISPFLGGLFRVHRRLTLSVETGFDFGFVTGGEVVSENKVLDVNELNDIDFKLPYIIRDLSLYYRF